jgi:hypothetical protein
VMIGPYAKRIRGAGYPWGPTEAEREEFLAEIQKDWGGPVGLEERAPSLAGDSRFRQWWATYLRMSASPAAAVALTKMNSQADIRSILPNISVPALVLHRTGDRCLLAEEGRYVAGRIPGARFVELPGVDHLPFVGDQSAILDHVQQFLTGAAVQRPNSGDVLATVVSASFKAPRGEQAYLGRRFRNRVAHDVERFNGRIFRSGRNRILASFDGPARAVRCACAIANHASRLGIEARLGLHIGECSIRHRELKGPALDLARRIESRADPGEILISATIRDLVAGSEIQFAERGTIAAANAEDGVLRLLSVDSR